MEPSTVLGRCAAPAAVNDVIRRKAVRSIDGRLDKTNRTTRHDCPAGVSVVRMRATWRRRQYWNGVRWCDVDCGEVLTFTKTSTWWYIITRSRASTSRTTQNGTTQRKYRGFLNDFK